MKERKIEKIKVKPRKGLTVLDIKGQPIPSKGIAIYKNTFYSRLIKTGDLEVVNSKKNDKPGA